MDHEQQVYVPAAQEAGRLVEGSKGKVENHKPVSSFRFPPPAFYLGEALVTKSQT